MTSNEIFIPTLKYKHICTTFLGRRVYMPPKLNKRSPVMTPAITGAFISPSATLAKRMPGHCRRHGSSTPVSYRVRLHSTRPSPKPRCLDLPRYGRLYRTPPVADGGLRRRRLRVQERGHPPLPPGSRLPGRHVRTLPSDRGRVPRRIAGGGRRRVPAVQGGGRALLQAPVAGGGGLRAGRRRCRAEE